MKRIHIFDELLSDEKNHSFEPYLDTLLTNQSGSLQQICIPAYCINADIGFGSQWFMKHRFALLKKLVMHDGRISTKQFVDIFNFNMCPNLLEVEIQSLDDPEKYEKESHVK